MTSARPAAADTADVVGRIWAAALGKAAVGENDGFFALGGELADALAVLDATGAALGTRVSLRDLFDSPTVAELIKAVEERERETAAPEPEDGHAHWRAAVADAPRVSSDTASGGDDGVTFSVPPATAAALRRLADAEHRPASMVLLAAFHALMLRADGRDDTLVAVRLPGEGGPPWALRTLTDEDTTFRQLLRQVGEQMCRAADHAGALSAAVPPGYREAVNRAVFTAEGAAPAEGAYDLQLRYSWRGDSLECTLDHGAAADASRFAGQLAVLLDEAGVRPDHRVDRLNLLAPGEWRTVVLNGTARPYEDGRPPHALVAAQAARTPDAVAVVCGYERMTYGELNAQANRLAHHLLSRGVRAGSPVGVCVGRRPSLIWSLLGVLKTGAVHVPLDPDYPAERLRFMLDDTGAEVVITDTQYQDRLPAAVTPVLVDGPLPCPTDDPTVPIDPDGVAYLLYTSGSTGRPKGVMLTHRALSNRLQEMRRQYALTADDGVLQFASASFDAAAEQIFPILMSGGRLVLRDAAHWGPGDVVDTIRDQGVTVAELPVALWEQVIPLLDHEQALGAPFRLLILSGEMIPAGSVANWFARVPADVCMTYAPTEATITATTHMLRGPGPVLIGTPIANTRLCVMDRSGGPVPVGVPGELWIGGVGVARGYWRRPGLTAERFVPSPFAEGERMYRSGDLVRLLPDGSLEILGRMDHQVKLRGQRVELGEIESTLVGHDDVTSVAVVLREDTPGAKRLVAYCVPAPGRAIDPDGARAWCRRTLPEYMVPSAFVVLDALPLNPNGKVDRRALPVPDAAGSAPEHATSGPRNEVEKIICEVWCEVLDVEDIGVHDNFFDLGGHSLLAVRVTNRIEALTGVKVGLVAFFQEPNVAALSRSVLELFARQEAASAERES